MMSDLPNIPELTQSPKKGIVRCEFCSQNFFESEQCVSESVHVQGRPLRLATYGDEIDPLRPHRDRCPSCGVCPGRHHHPGCQIQECLDCAAALMRCGCDELDEFVPRVPIEITPLGINENGVPVELHSFPELDVLVYIDDLPESDLTVVDGLPCTTVVRTLIDCAITYGEEHLEWSVRNALDRKIMTISEALDRIAQPDMQNHRGAKFLGQVLARVAR